MKTSSSRSLLTTRIALAVIAATFLSHFAHATDGVWTLNNSGIWSTPGNWVDSTVADGAGSIADFSQLNISGDRTVTIDGTVASSTIGTLLFGDIDSTHRYTIAASGGGTLTFDNNSSSALITQGANSGGNIISAPVVLADNLAINNNSDATLSITTGGITGGFSITNQGAGTGGVSIGSGVITLGVTGVIQDSATSSLTLSGTNTFTTGVTIKKGTVLANANAALGTGTLLLGDTTGSASATLLINSFTIANNITVQAGTAGTLTIGSNGGVAARPTGDILLNNHLTLSVDSQKTGSNTGALLSTSGTISGTGNLNINVSGGLSTSNNTNSPQMDSLSITGSVTTFGSINNVGTGAGRAIISGVIENASSVNQNSATSMLTLGATTANTYTGATNVNAGVLRISTLTGLSANSTVTVASGGSLQFGQTSSTAINAGQTLNLSGDGTAYSVGAVLATNNAAYAGSIVLQADATIATDLGTLTLSGGITGTNRNLTITGASNTTISGAIDTGTGGLVKRGAGLLVLSGTNSYTGVTTLINGATRLDSAGAFGGGGSITFDGGSLRHSSTNELDYAGRIVNSIGSISIDTNGRNVTYAGNIAASNTGGLTKLGSARLTLSGTNAFTGPVAVNAGVLAISAASAIPSVGSGQIFIDTAGALNNGGAYATLQEWLDSDNIATNSTGAIALTGSGAQNIDFTGYGSLSLGASSTSTYTGTITPAGGLYRLGGGGAVLTLSGTDALTGVNGLVVANGNVTLSGANNLTGATTVASSTLTLSGAAGSVAGSNVTVNSGAILAVTANTATPAVTRAASATLNGGSLVLTGNNTANSTDSITGALTIDSGGNSVVTLTGGNKNVLLTGGSLVRNAGGTALIRGQLLGVNAFASPGATSSNIQLTTPNLVGGLGANTTDEGILVGVVGDTASNGSGFGATGGLLTYDGTNGVRLVSAYKTSITDGQTQLDNVQLSSVSGTATTTINSDTTINSLSLKRSGATSAAVQVGGTGVLMLNSGVIYSGSVTATAVSGISNEINFNNREGIILNGGTADLNLSGILSGTDKGVTLYGNSTNVDTVFSGTAPNSYTGTTTLNGGRFVMSKTDGVNAIGGDLVINAGSAVMSVSNQIADTANVTVNGGGFYTLNETINNLTMTSGGIVKTQGAGSNPSYNRTLNVDGNLTISDGAVLTATIQGKTNVAGTTSLSNGGSIIISRSQSTVGVYDSVATLGALNITNGASGPYSAITIDSGSGYAQSGGQLVLNGDVTFTGNSTNTNTVSIDSPRGTGHQGQIALTGSIAGNRTFNIGNGAAAVDFALNAPLVDGAGGASGLTKTGTGTLALTGVNIYTGATTISAGTLVLSSEGSISSSSGVNLGTAGSQGTLDLTAKSAFSFGATQTVSGSGTINIGSGKTVTVAGNLNPGNSPGQVNVTGDLAFLSTTVTTMELAGSGGVKGTDFDNVTSSGAFTYDGTLSIVSFGGFNILQAGTYSLFDFASQSGNFDSVTFGGNALSYSSGIWSGTNGGFDYSLVLSSGDLAVTVVPEPATWALLAFSLTTVLVLRRRRA